MNVETILTENKKQYEKDQDQLLKTLLDLRFFNPWKGLTRDDSFRSLWHDTKLELYVTSTCNQNCAYCYLVRYPKLYPKEYNKPDLILNNLRVLLDYIVANQMHLPCIDIFSGEIWSTQFGWSIFDILYEYITEGGARIDSIMMTSNCSFINNPEAFQRMQQYVDKFRDIACPIQISISVDGKVVDDFSRPRNDKTAYDDKFYDKLFAFAKHNNFLFHPMVAAENIAYWIENYKWWHQQNKKFNLTDDDLMLLEVRNDGWTDQNIEDYNKFLNYLMDLYLKNQCKNDPKLFGNALIGARRKGTEPVLSGYVPWSIGPTDTFTGCTVANHLTVRLGDLAICPCHRQAYNQYLYGYFNVENNRITGVRAVNPQMAVKILMGNVLTSTPLCDQCDLNYCCLKGCHGSQLETEKDPFFPIDNICKFFHAKYANILKWYKEHGIIDYLKTWTPAEPGAAEVANLLQLYDKMEARKNGMGTTV